MRWKSADFCRDFGPFFEGFRFGNGNRNGACSRQISMFHVERWNLPAIHKARMASSDASMFHVEQSVGHRVRTFLVCPLFGAAASTLRLVPRSLNSPRESSGVRSIPKSRKKVRMDFPNAFIGKKNKPSAKNLSATLGPALSAWNELVEWLTGKGLNCSTWHSVSPKYGWALRPALKARNILYLGPCNGCFRVSFVLSDRAVAAAGSSDLPPGLLKQIAEARRYAEGTGIRLLVKTSDDLGNVRQLTEIKLKC